MASKSVQNLMIHENFSSARYLFRAGHAERCALTVASGRAGSRDGERGSLDRRSMLRWNARVVGSAASLFRPLGILRDSGSSCGCIGGGQPEGFPSRSSRYRDAPDSENELSWADREP